MFTLLSMTPYFPIASGFILLAFIAFFQTNSAWADKIGQPKGNRLFVIAGSIIGAIGLYLMYMAITTSGGTGG